MTHRIIYLSKYKMLSCDTHVNKKVHHGIWGLGNRRIFGTVVHHIIQVRLSLDFLQLVFLRLQWYWWLYVFVDKSWWKWTVFLKEGTVNFPQWTDIPRPLTFTAVTKISIVCSYMSIHKSHQRNTVKLKRYDWKCCQVAKDVR